MPQVTVYTTQTCGYCKATKEYLNQNQVAFTEIDVTSDRDKAREMIEKSGQMGVPVILVEQENDQEEMIIGFDQQKLSQALGLPA